MSALAIKTGGAVFGDLQLNASAIVQTVLVAAGKLHLDVCFELGHAGHRLVDYFRL